MQVGRGALSTPHTTTPRAVHAARAVHPARAVTTTWLTHTLPLRLPTRCWPSAWAGQLPSVPYRTLSNAYPPVSPSSRFATSQEADAELLGFGEDDESDIDEEDEDEEEGGEDEGEGAKKVGGGVSRAWARAVML